MSSDYERLSGRVVRLKGMTAFVEIERAAECAGCKACALAAKKTTRLYAVNDVGAEEGDNVLVSLAPQKPLVATLMLFLLPLVLMLSGIIVAVTLGLSEPMTALFAAIGIAVGFLIAFAFDRLYYSKRHISHITEILNNDTEILNHDKEI